jgi:indolepyruvate ferredoxin oxidoreductase, alpha subunit
MTLETAGKIKISSDAPGARLFVLGNEAIARGAIEAGAEVVAAYPGTPSTEIVETLMNSRGDLNMQVEWSVNEKVAFGTAFGASLCGVRAMAVMKHVGVNVALDSIMTAAYIGAAGGLVLVEAEDPGQWSSQDEQDNRFVAEMAYLPTLEPSSAGEARDMTADAFALSEKYGQPFMLRSVTRIGHSRSDLTLGKIARKKPAASCNIDPHKLVMLPDVARKHRRLMIARLEKIKKDVDSWAYNAIEQEPGARLGIIASGISYSFVKEALAWMQLQEQVSVLKIGTPYPLPEQLVTSFLRGVPRALIVEELEPYLENHIKALAQMKGIGIPIHGKDTLPVSGEYTARIVSQALGRIFNTNTAENFAAIDARVREAASLLPDRPPGLCAGCPHRASHLIIKTVCQRIKRRTGVEPIRPGDIGCNCLGVQSPMNDVDISTCMGGGYDLASGLARVTDAPVIAHLGDSTFFHSGMPPLVNAAHHGKRITLIVLDNQTTAMTGAQPSPSGLNPENTAISPIKPEDIARACGIKFVAVVDPLDRDEAIKKLEKAVSFKGTSFLVFRRACAIVEQREKRARGEKIVPCEVQQAKCLAAAPPYCTATCPLHVDARGYVKLVGEGKYDQALKLIQQKLPFPGIMGRICTRPCEGKCKRGEIDESIAIAALKRVAADFGKLDDDELAVTHRRTEKVAIVGGGPAGCLAAYDLGRLGYQVELFDASPALGGMLTAAIPRYRLPEEIIHRDLDRMEKLGIKIRLNTRIGKDIPFERLMSQHQAVFLAPGAQRGKRLDIPNPAASASTRGVIEGIEFLKAVNAGKQIEAKGRVAVIGGGNVAVDCARTCLRLGFKYVEVLYRRDKKRLPAIAAEVAEAEREGVSFRFLVTPVEILAKGAQVSGLVCGRIQPGKSVEDRSQALEVQEGANFEIETDLVINATGEEPDLVFLNDTPLATERGLIKADPLTLATNIPGVFAGGDAVSGPATAVEALAAGRKAAISIDRYLKGEDLKERREGEGTHISPLQVETEDIAKRSRREMPLLAEGRRSNNMTEVELGYTREQAAEEAARCLHCGCEKCMAETGCPAIMVEDGKVSIDSSQCPGCGLCAEFCPTHAITAKS